MDERQKLTVPDLVGQPVHIAKRSRRTLGLVSQPGTLTGRGSVRVRGPGFRVTSQDPSAGSVVGQGSQIRITFVQDGQARSDVPEQTGAPTPSLKTHAEAEKDE